MAGQYDTTLEIGDDWQRAIDVKDADGSAVDPDGVCGAGSSASGCRMAARWWPS